MLATLFSSLLAAQASSVVLLTESTNAAYDGKGISAYHEAAGMSTGFLTDISTENQYPMQYDEAKDQFYFVVNPEQNINFYLGETYRSLSYTPGADIFAHLKDGYLAVNGSTSVFYVCPGYVPLDPYHYASKGANGVSVFAEGDEDHPENCEPIKIKVAT